MDSGSGVTAAATACTKVVCADIIAARVGGGLKFFGLKVDIGVLECSSKVRLTIGADLWIGEVGKAVVSHALGEGERRFFGGHITGSFRIVDRVGGQFFGAGRCFIEVGCASDPGGRWIVATTARAEK